MRLGRTQTPVVGDGHVSRGLAVVRSLNRVDDQFRLIGIVRDLFVVNLLVETAKTVSEGRNLVVDGGLGRLFGVVMVMGVVSGDIVFASGGGVGSVKKAVFVVSLLDEGVARAVLAVVFGVVDGAVDILETTSDSGVVGSGVVNLIDQADSGDGSGNGGGSGDGADGDGSGGHFVDAVRSNFDNRSGSGVSDMFDDGGSRVNGVVLDDSRGGVGDVGSADSSHGGRMSDMVLFVDNGGSVRDVGPSHCGDGGRSDNVFLMDNAVTDSMADVSPPDSGDGGWVSDMVLFMNNGGRVSDVGSADSSDRGRVSDMMFFVDDSGGVRDVGPSDRGDGRDMVFFVDDSGSMRDMGPSHSSDGSRVSEMMFLMDNTTTKAMADVSPPDSSDGGGSGVRDVVLLVDDTAVGSGVGDAARVAEGAVSFFDDAVTEMGGGSGSGGVKVVRDEVAVTRAAENAGSVVSNTSSEAGVSAGSEGSVSAEASVSAVFHVSGDIPSGIAVVSGLSLGEGLGKDGRECDEEDKTEL